MSNIRNLCKLLRLFWKRQTHLSGRSSVAPESRYSPEQGFAGGTTCPSAERQSWVSSTATDGGGRRASKFSCHVLEKVFRDCVSLLYGFSHSASSVGKKKKKRKRGKRKKSQRMVTLSYFMRVSVCDPCSLSPRTVLFHLSCGTYHSTHVAPELRNLEDSRGGIFWSQPQLTSFKILLIQRHF